MPIVGYNSTAMAAQRTIGNYRFEEKLGSGGMGVVHRAFDMVLERSVAIKMMHGAEMLGDVDVNEIQERFLREARAAARIKSRHIAQVLQMGRSDAGEAYIVMELLDGIALNKELHRVGRMPVARALHIGKQICRAMSAAHELGVIHRDLKPANVMLVNEEDDPDFVKVLDFGIAKLADGRNGLTQTGALLGTLPFMAPEQISGKEVDRRVDIYSLGILLYRMITGTPLFDAENLSDVVRQQLVVPPQPMAERLGPLVPISPVLDAVVLRCLEKDRERRFSSMMELFQGLQSVTGAASEVPARASPGPVYAPTVPMMPAQPGGTEAEQSGAVAGSGVGTAPTNTSALWSHEASPEDGDSVFSGATAFTPAATLGAVMPASAVTTLQPERDQPVVSPVTRTASAPISPGVRLDSGRTSTFRHEVEAEALEAAPLAPPSKRRWPMAAAAALLIVVGLAVVVGLQTPNPVVQPVVLAPVTLPVTPPVTPVIVDVPPVSIEPVATPQPVASSEPVVIPLDKKKPPVKPKKAKDEKPAKEVPVDDGFVRVHTKDGT
jgi:eukaryotic-like serine/threonine-protein kinase